MPESSQECYQLLRDVSRSFYLTLRILPGKIRWPIGLAYLLARTTDTIADTEMVRVGERLRALRALQARIAGREAASLELHQLARQQGTPGEGRLLDRVDQLLAELRRLPDEDQKRVREVLETITSGQELDLTRFGDASAGRIVALQNEAELEDYTYRVAGCVGAFWTKMCRARLFPSMPMDDAGLLRDGIRFGKGLQLVNILRDLPSDLGRGRCYFPADKLAASGLRPEDLRHPENEARFRPPYHECLRRAGEHLVAGWAYTRAMPYTQLRLRLACAWPILFGNKTLEKLATAPILDARHRVKVSRATVRSLMVKSLLYYPWPSVWNRLFVPVAPGGAIPAGSSRAV